MKKNHKKIIFSALAVAVFVPLVSMASSDNFSLSEKNKKSVQYRNSSSENFEKSSVDKALMSQEREARRASNRSRHSELMSVLERGDYDAWLEFSKTRDCSMSSKVNRDNFSEFVQAHRDKVGARGLRNHK